MRRADSLEKSLMLGKIEGRRRGQQRKRWLDGITDLMNMSLSELRELPGCATSDKPHNLSGLSFSPVGMRSTPALREGAAKSPCAACVSAEGDRFSENCKFKLV